MFCTIFVSSSMAKVLEKRFRSSSYLVLDFFKGNSLSHSKFTDRLILLQLLYTKFLIGDRKIDKIYQRWIFSALNYAFEITSLRKIVLYETDFATFTVLSCVTSCPVCFTDKYLRKTSFNELRGKSTTAATSKIEFFVTLVNVVN